MCPPPLPTSTLHAFSRIHGVERQEPKHIGQDTHIQTHYFATLCSVSPPPKNTFDFLSVTQRLETAGDVVTPPFEHRFYGNRFSFHSRRTRGVKSSGRARGHLTLCRDSKEPVSNLVCTSFAVSFPIVFQVHGCLQSDAWGDENPILPYTVPFIPFHSIPFEFSSRGSSHDHLNSIQSVRFRAVVSTKRVSLFVSLSVVYCFLLATGLQEHWRLLQYGKRLSVSAHFLLEISLQKFVCVRVLESGTGAILLL